MLEPNEIYNVDCLFGLRSIDDCSIDLIATDVPYRLTARGSSGSSGGMMTKQLTKEGLVFKDNAIDIEEYIGEFYRVLKQGTHCYIMCNNLNIVHFLDVISKSEFHFIKCLIWEKDNKVMGNCYMGQYEYIIMMRKGPARRVNNCGISDILKFPNKKTKGINGYNIHDSQKPVDLFRVLVSQSTDAGDLVLDPFIGSGTTAIACVREKRKYIGFEINDSYCEIANGRLNKEIKELSLF